MPNLRGQQHVHMFQRRVNGREQVVIMVSDPNGWGSADQDFGGGVVIGAPVGDEGP